MLVTSVDQVKLNLQGRGQSIGASLFIKANEMAVLVRKAVIISSVKA